MGAEPGAGSIQYEAHLLDSVPSPMVRALPVYERDFRGHLLRAQAVWAASQSRLQDAEQLLSELVSPHLLSASLVEAINDSLAYGAAVLGLASSRRASNVVLSHDKIHVGFSCGTGGCLPWPGCGLNEPISQCPERRASKWCAMELVFLFTVRKQSSCC